MEEQALKSLQKDVRRKKRIATERASEVHDIVEDRLFSDFEQLVEKSQQTYEACLAWALADANLQKVLAE